VSYPITSAVYNNVTGVATLSAAGYAPTANSNVTLAGLSFICSSASRPNAGQLMFPQLVFPRDATTGSTDPKPFTYTKTGANTLTYQEVVSANSPDHEYVSGGTVVIGGTNYGVTAATYNQTSGLVTITTATTLPGANNSTGTVTVGGLVFICPTSAYVVTSSVPISGGYRVEFFSDTNGGLKYPIAAGQKLDFRNRSQISAPSHTFEYVGSGTNYDALPWNGGVPNSANEIVETNNGRVYSSNTNEKGDFKVGKQFGVDGTTGSVTISTDEFNLAGLNYIGPFSRNGGLSTVGEQLREISNNPSLIASTGGVDGNTVPTQFAVKSYTTNSFLQDVTVTTGLPLTINETSSQDGQGYWTRRRNLNLSLNVPNGLARLDGGGLIPSALLPAYVDDVLEYANLAAFPATGEGGKIYVALDTTKTYRWSGTAYTEISPSPGSTDSVTEGSVNLYYTQARSRESVSSSAGTPLTYDQATGVFTFSYGTTGTPQFAGIGVGVAPATGWGMTIGQGVCQRLRTVTAVGSTYTLDVLTGNEFRFAAAVNGAVIVNLSNLASIPSGYTWRGVFSFTFTSGSVSFFSGNGQDKKWDGIFVPALTTGEDETFIVSVTGGVNTIEIAAMRGRT